MLAPIVIFAYNRPDHLKLTLKSLRNNKYAKDSILYVYCDGPRMNATDEDLDRIQKVRNVVNEITWSKGLEVINREKNLGLARNIVDGVTEVVNKHGKIIVLEDDIVTSPGFLPYMNEALDTYENETQVMHISGFFWPVKADLPPTFYYNAASCWGWGTWKNAWENFEPNAEFLKEKIDRQNLEYHFNLNGYANFYQQLEDNIVGVLKTWAIKWHTSVYLKKGLCLHPNRSLVTNVGFDGSGENCPAVEPFLGDLADSIPVRKINAEVENEIARLAMIEYLKEKNSKSFLGDLVARLRRKLNISNILAC